MLCPKCPGVELDEMDLEGIKLDFCASSCQGVWADKGELAALIPGDADLPFLNEYAVDGTQTDINCPRCSVVKLKEISFEENGGLMLDYCPSCQGLWFDFKEMGHARKRVEQLLKDSHTFRENIRKAAKDATKEDSLLNRMKKIFNL